jgi:hypothetical protein
MGITTQPGCRLEERSSRIERSRHPPASWRSLAWPARRQRDREWVARWRHRWRRRGRCRRIRTPVTGDGGMLMALGDARTSVSKWQCPRCSGRSLASRRASAATTGHREQLFRAAVVAARDDGVAEDGEGVDAAPLAFTSGCARKRAAIERRSGPCRARGGGGDVGHICENAHKSAMGRNFAHA